MSVYGSFGACERPATAPGGTAKKEHPQLTASHNTATRKCADDIDFETIVALSRQFTIELDVKQNEKAALIKIISDAKRQMKQYLNHALQTKSAAKMEKIRRQYKEIEKKFKDTDHGNTTLRHELAGLLRENEKLACEVETMTEQMQELLRAYDEHKDQVSEVQHMMTTYRREINNEKKLRDEIHAQVRTNKTAKDIMEERVADADRRKYLLKTCIADVFVASAS